MNPLLETAKDVPAEWYEDMRKQWEREKRRADAYANVLRLIASGRLPMDYGKDAVTVQRQSNEAAQVLFDWS